MKGNTRPKVRPNLSGALTLADYSRISSEDQVGNFSIAAQQRANEIWAAKNNYTIVKRYVDEAKSGKTANRPDFQQMLRDAQKGLFNALLVNKFDRFARNRADALAIKTILRHEYGIKVFSATEPSEDSDGVAGAISEGIMEVLAEMFIRNLSIETQKGKKERAMQGFHNNIPPFGFKRNEEKILIPDEKTIDGLKMAFELYATDDYSDVDIANILNEKGYRTKHGRPFSKDTIRDFLQNEIYLGKVSYQPFIRNPDGTRCRTAPIEWFKGKHDAVISEELYRRCQEVRVTRAHHHQKTIKRNPYLLRGIVYCYDCCCKSPEVDNFPSYGKMRAQAYENNMYMCYRCRARELGYECDQQRVRAEILDTQVLEILTQLKPPAKWRQNITASIGELLGMKDLEQRLEEIRTIIKRMDMRWDNGFITDEQEYVQQRMKLQQELEQLLPVDNDELERAADLLTNFATHWYACKTTDAKAELINKIVQRVYVQGKSIVAITLRSNCHLVLGYKTNEPTAFTVDPFLVETPSSPVKAEVVPLDRTMVSHGDDGRWSIGRPYELIALHENISLYSLYGARILVLEFA